VDSISGHLPGEILPGLNAWRIGSAPATSRPPREVAADPLHDMEAGRQLDVQVAEAIFSTNAQRNEPWWRRGPLRAPRRSHDATPAFSTEWGAAGALIDALLARPDVVSVSVAPRQAGADGEEGWDCTIVLAGAKPRRVCAVAPTGPHAVSLSALAATSAD
jgi:hypothetical protein